MRAAGFYFLELVFHFQDFVHFIHFIIFLLCNKQNGDQLCDTQSTLLVLKKVFEAPPVWDLNLLHSRHPYILHQRCDALVDHKIDSAFLEWVGRVICHPSLLRTASSFSCSRKCCHISILPVFMRNLGLESESINALRLRRAFSNMKQWIESIAAVFSTTGTA